MNAKTLEAIKRHGESLLAAFPNCTERDPVALCKKLRRIENAISKPILDYTNGDNGMTTEQLDELCHKALFRVESLLFADGAIGGSQRLCGLFVNRDPRGYALKLDDEWTRNYNNGKTKNGPCNWIPIYTDWGGCGILAPDLNQ